MAWAPNYIEVADLKAYLRIDDSVDDAELTLAVAAASRAVDQHTSRQFGQDDIDTERYYTARWDRRRSRWVVDIDDLFGTPEAVDADNDEDDSFDTAIDSFVLEPRNAGAEGRPFTRIAVAKDSAGRPTAGEQRTRVTATFGWPEVPDAVKQATLLQAGRFFARREAPFGVAGSPEVGSEMRLLARVDPDVAVILGPYTIWWGVV